MEYGVTVYFDSETVSQLNEKGFTLISFISSASNSSASAFPLCCGLVDEFLSSLKITFNDNFFAYVSSSPLLDGEEIYIEQPPPSQAELSLATASISSSHPIQAELSLATASISSSYPIQLGQTFTLNSDLTVTITSNKTNQYSDKK